MLIQEMSDEKLKVTNINIIMNELMAIKAQIADLQSKSVSLAW